MTSFFQELKRRNVVRVALFYAVTAWLILQAGDVLFALLGLPDWTLKLVLGGLLLCFPVALVFSWIYEVTPEGIKLEKDIDRTQSITPETGRKLNNATLIVATVAIVLVVMQLLGFRPPESAEDATVDTGTETPSNPAAEPAAEPADEATKPVSADTRPSVAVLPFADMSPGKDQEYFSDGLADTLMHVLAQVDGLKVAARTSSFAFKGKNMDVGRIAEQLGVKTILEGSVQKAGDKIRVIAQLVDAGDGSHLWSKNFDRDLADIFSVQDEIAREVVAALKVTLLEDDQAALASRYQPTLEAYEQFILGRREMETREIERLEQAAEHFEKAIELDPDYALAYVNLADAYSLIQFYGDLETAESARMRRPLLERALELEPRLGEVYASLAQVADDMDEPAQAEAHYRRAIELNPNYATAYHWYSVYLRTQDRLDEALAMIRKAAELDPMAPIIRTNVTESLIQLGRIEEAEVEAEKNLELNPEFTNHFFDMVWIRRIQGRFGEAQRWVDAMVAADPARTRGRANLECAGLLELAYPTAAESCFRELERIAPDSFHRQRIEASAFLVHQGRYAEAIDQIRSVAERLPGNSPQRQSVLVDLAWGLAIDGQLEAASDTLAGRYPGLFQGELPPVLSSNLEDLGLGAWLLRQAGQTDRSETILERIDSWLAPRHRTRGGFYGLEDAAVHMVRGHDDKALATIRQAIDENWRSDWWFYFRHDPRFRPLHGHPDYQAMVAEVESDMLAQREWYDAHRNEPLL